MIQSMTRQGRRLAQVAALWIAIGAPAGRADVAAASDTVPLLFHPVPVAATASADVSGVVKRSRLAMFDPSAVPVSSEARGQLLGVNLFDDTDVDGEVLDVVTGTGGRFTLVGRLRGQAGSEFVLTCGDNVMVGTVRTGDDRVFRVRVVDDQVHAIEELEMRRLPGCGTLATDHGIAAGQEASNPLSVTTADDGSTIDLMVVYTPSARASAGGTSGMLSLIDNAVTQANVAYQNSQIATRLRLVHVAEIGYTESGSFNTDLNRVTNTSDGYMDEAHDWRNTYGADVVSLIINNSQYCGLGWLMQSLSSGFASNAFNAVHWSCLPGQTLAHEIGHNQGCMHDRENSPYGGLYSYSYGWRFVDGGGTLRRTIMAYEPGSRISHFSNPSVSYNGVATGVAVGQPDESHNARTINNSAATVANFRQATMGLVPPTGVSASDGTYTNRVVVTWNSVVDADSYQVWRNTSNATNSASRIVTTAATTYADTTADPGRTYYYWVKTVNQTGTSGFSASDTGYVLDNTPSAPTNLRLTVVSSSRIDLAWTDNADNETGFRIERATASAGPWSQLGAVTANVTAYSSTGLVACSEYFYRVKAYNSDADSEYSSVASASTTGCLPPPNSPGNLSGVALTATSVGLSWIDNATNESSVDIETAPSSGGPWTAVVTLGANAVSYTHTGRTPATTYYYRVRAVNNGGPSAWSNIASVTMPQVPPAAPTSLGASAISSSRIDLGWTDNAMNEEAYEVDRGPTVAGPWTTIATLPSNTESYASTGLDSVTAYYYRVRATNQAGPSAYSNVTGATTMLSLPTPPDNLVVTGVTDNSVALSWTDNASNEFSFNVERAQAATGPWFLVGNVASNVTAFTSGSLASCATYYYRVRAYNMAGYSDYTSVASATTTGCQPVAPSAPADLKAAAAADDTIVLRWTDTSSGESAFKVQRATTATGPWKTIGLAPVDATVYASTGLTGATVYYYRVRAINIAGQSSWTAVASAKTQKPGTPDAPSDLAATVVAGSVVDLSWTDHANNETQFKVQRRLAGTSTWTLLATLGANATAYTDTTVSAGLVYEYRVKAKNNTGASAASNVVTVPIE
jgi:fibronectin type 3 domain-containing protein